MPMLTDPNLKSAPSKRRARPPLTVMLSVALLSAAILTAALSSVLAPNATRNDVLNANLAPGSPGHLWGTDQLGRDIVDLTIAGASSALLGPATIALGAAVIGLVLGSIAGYFGRWSDMLISRWVDLLFALPVLLVAIVVVGVFGGSYWLTVSLLIVLFSPGDIRLVRAAVMEQRARPYIAATQLAGIRPRRIIAVHILPNITPLVLAQTLVNFGYALVSMSALSFLGLGIPPGAADWGRQLSDNRGILAQNPASVVVPALCIILVACAANLIGDWVSERLQRITPSGES